MQGDAQHPSFAPNLCLCSQKWQLGFLVSLYTFFNSFEFWLGWVFFAEPQLSLVAERRDSSLVAVHRLLTVAASLVSEPGLQGPWTSAAAVPGSRAQVR